MKAKEILEQYIINEVNYDKNRKELKIEEDLLKSGIIDSMAIIKLVTFIEETFNMKIAEEDLIPENFQSIENMTKYVKLRAGMKQTD